MQSRILLSDSNGTWNQIPNWARFLINFGYKKKTLTGYSRIIILLSMPCDSVASGLIALGAMIRDLENSESNDIRGHYDGLLNYAEQYLKHCKNCSLDRCDPDKKGCGYTAKATGVLRNTRESSRRKTYLISDKTEPDKRILRIIDRQGCTSQPSPDYSLQWHIDGEPPVQLAESSRPISSEIFEEIAYSKNIISDNLTKSFSGLCLAGRVSGESETKRVMSSMRFKTSAHEFSLLHLLTISGWSDVGDVSRIVYFNSRNCKFDRPPASVRLVVADGDTCFLRVLEEKSFQYSDVIGVYRRTIDRDKMDKITDRLTDLRQWYSEIPITELVPGKVPIGINSTVLVKTKQ